MNIVIERFEERHISAAVILANKEQEVARKHCPALPDEDCSERLTGMLQWLSGQRFGKVALLDGEVIGYLLFCGPWDGMFGNVKGVFSPLGGSAFSYENGIDRGRLASMLFAEISAELVQEQVFSCAVCRYANDKETAEAFVMNGFGIRCSDAVQEISKLAMPYGQGSVHFMELLSEDIERIRNLRKGLVEHLANAPTFCPTDMERYEEWFQRKGIRVFVAESDGETIGFISLEDDGENYITEHEKMKNICGAYFDERYRSCGLAQLLLRFICCTLADEGVQYLGVDYETINPTALNFWSKYFTPYTYSYARRFDER